MEFLAKTDGTTVLSHTMDLIKNFDLLMAAYPEVRQKVNAKALFLACVYHDLGKINKNFQKEIRLNLRPAGIPHGILSTAFINDGIKGVDLKVLMHAVALHHERDKRLVTNELFREEISAMNEVLPYFMEDLDKLQMEYRKRFGFDTIFNVPAALPSVKYLRAGEEFYGEDDELREYIMEKGLLNRIDYAASNGTEVEAKGGFLRGDLEKFRERENIKWNDLQEFAMKNSEHNIVLTAMTGYGKTLAGLLWLGGGKGFFTLPIRSAINSIYFMAGSRIFTEDEYKKFSMLYSGALGTIVKAADKKDGGRAARNFFMARQLALPLTICTMDQLFGFVFMADGFEAALATLAYSKVIIDEIQMYSPKTVGFLIYGIKRIAEIGGKFAVMTATLPPVICDFMREEGISFKSPAPFIDNDLVRHNVLTIDDSLSAPFIAERYKGGKMLVIVNTVKKAQELYDELCEETGNVSLIHSRFIKKDRMEKERRIQEFSCSGDSGIWIGTQVVEASLDIDFDVLVTEMSDLAGFFQRLGRCYRKRSQKGGHNCYLFIKGCTGASFIDREIHRKSCEILKGFSGPLTEKEKLLMISQVYSVESLRGTEYIRKVKGAIRFCKNLQNRLISRSESQKMLRDIKTVDVIPKSVFEGNREEILRYGNILQDSKAPFEEKMKARGEAEEFLVPLPSYLACGAAIQEYGPFTVIECGYSEERGVEF